LATENHRKVIRQRKQREKKQRRNSIIAAAEKVFIAKGYAKATMDEIALQAEISKPTIYQYFNTKDDLFFSLMLPVIEEIGRQLLTVKNKLSNGKYETGHLLIRDMFRGLWMSYDLSPDVFRIVQLFQQSGLVQQLNPEIRRSLNEKGRHNFMLARQIISKGIEQRLLKNLNPYEFVDIIWGLFVGIIQLEDIKSQQKSRNAYLKATLTAAELFLTDAVATGPRKKSSDALRQEPNT
jgi:AcrR family transcriptional regulator